jgi:hypothetical protein
LSCVPGSLGTALAISGVLDSVIENGIHNTPFLYVEIANGVITPLILIGCVFSVRKVVKKSDQARERFLRWD